LDFGFGFSRLFFVAEKKPDTGLLVFGFSKEPELKFRFSGFPSDTRLVFSWMSGFGFLRMLALFFAGISDGVVQSISDTKLQDGIRLCNRSFALFLSMVFTKRFVKTA
jgi:hypothetical protein